MSNLTHLSGVVVNQNRPPTNKVDPETVWIYQTFRLPENYEYENPSRVPELSGFQLLVQIEEGKAADVMFEYSLEEYIVGEGWTFLIRDSGTGCHTDGEKIWIDVIFSKAVEIATPGVTPFRIGIRNIGESKENIAGVWYTSPNPVVGGEALKGMTSIPGAFDFRILALVADSGVDYLGNQYRSIVTNHDIANTSTTQGVNSGYWRSSPQPSKFAVVSNYFDIRPNVGPEEGEENLALDPNFEYDKAGSEPAGWTKYIQSTSVGEVRVSNTWSAAGIQSCFIESQSTKTNAKLGIKSEVVVEPLFQYWFFCNAHLTKVPTLGTLKIEVCWFNSKGDEIGAVTESFKEDLVEQGVRSVAPPEAKKAAIRIYFEGSGNFEGYVDNIFFGTGREKPGYFDGDSPSCTWKSTRGLSPSIANLSESRRATAVVDGVFLDPQTPNVTFNVYYSSDGSANETTTVEEWENKLWTRVPRVFTATQRQTYTFPEPIRAAFMKIEYSHLQATSYDPGIFQSPVNYKKFPIWVTDVFLAELQLPNFIANRVNVVNDTLSFAYRYYLDDLHIATEGPKEIDDTVLSSLNTFFNESDAKNKVDPETLGQINTLMNIYIDPPAAQGDDKTLLGNKAALIAFDKTNYPVEGVPEQVAKNLERVSRLDREDLVFQESIPAMFFPITCRHAYKELASDFSHNRAYFAGVNEIAFVRNNYTEKFDGDLYIESGGDTTNTDINDFVIGDDLVWSVY